MTVHSWSEEFEVGHGEIDHHHEELFSLTTMIDEAVFSQKRVDIERILHYLEHYVDDHFKEEEELMLSHEYSGYDIHKNDHEVFKARVFSLRHDFDSGLPDMRVIFGLRMFVDKLVHHIKTIDKGIADIVKEGQG